MLRRVAYALARGRYGVRTEKRPGRRGYFTSGPPPRCGPAPANFRLCAINGPEHLRKLMRADWLTAERRPGIHRLGAGPCAFEIAICHCIKLARRAKFIVGANRSRRLFNSRCPI